LKRKQNLIQTYALFIEPRRTSKIRSEETSRGSNDGDDGCLWSLTITKVGVTRKIELISESPKNTGNVEFCRLEKLSFYVALVCDTLSK
jgi:hypothetical protein